MAAPSMPAPRSRYRPEEIQLIRLLYPDIDTIVEKLPHRTRCAILNTIRIYKIRASATGHKNSKWTKADDTILLSSTGSCGDRARLLPHRSTKACVYRIQVIGPRGQRHRARFSQEELDLVLAGATTLPGRSKRSIKNLRDRLGLFARRGPRNTWTDDEIEALRADPNARLPGRTARAIKHKRMRLGIGTRNTKRSPQDFWKSVMAAITAAVPHGLPYQVRQEVISEIAVGFVEAGIDADTLAAKVKEAIRNVYRQYPVLGAHLSLDAPIFDDSGTTIGDRIASDRFHF